MKPVTQHSVSLLLAGLVAYAAPSSRAIAASTNTHYVETDLVADATGTSAAHVDANLVNPWGLLRGPWSYWVADNGTGMITMYSPLGVSSKTTIMIPAPGTATTAGMPTAAIMNDSWSFNLTSGTVTHPATVLVATGSGTIVGWSDRVNSGTPMTVVDNSASGAIYTGLAIARVPAPAATTPPADDDGDTDSDQRMVPQLYAANFHAGVVEVYDASFKPVTTFTDKTVPAGFAPYGIRAIRGKLYVTFAKQSTDMKTAVAGAGNGYVDIFNPDGTLVKQFVAAGALNSPWGLTVARGDFGAYSHALLVGNNGDGLINAYNLKTGALLGHLTKADGSDLAIDGLWSIDIGSDDHGWGRSDDHRRWDRTGDGSQAKIQGDGATLYFTAGTSGGTHGLFGALRPVDMDTDSD